MSRAKKYRVTYSWPSFLTIMPEKNGPLCPAGHFCTKLGPLIKLVNMAHVSLLPGGAILRGAMQAAGPGIALGSPEKEIASINLAK